ncbi:Protein memo1 [Savitreella phatthalungensis]
MKRKASHAGSWYPASPAALRAQLNGYLELVPRALRRQKDCRYIISPHAGYAYSGATAAHGFAALDFQGVKTIFVLGPSHHVYLRTCALSKCSTYATPLGDFIVDRDLTSELYGTELFEKMSISVDEDEHSLEMQLPFLRLVMTDFLNDHPEHPEPQLVPIIVGSLGNADEIKYAELLAPYFARDDVMVVISSDFAHWGERFRYTYYSDATPVFDPLADEQPSSSTTLTTSNTLTKRVLPRSQREVRSLITDLSRPPIHESIRACDFLGMHLCSHGSHADFTDYLHETGNTICGRHPIGVFLAAQEALGGLLRPIKWLYYDRSSLVESVTESSVSYASGVSFRRLEQGRH